MEYQQKAKNDAPHPPKKKLEVCNVGHKLAAGSGFTRVSSFRGLFCNLMQNKLC
jgi:hypothetical protein